MLRPFAANDSLYAAIQVGPLLLDYVGRRMMMSHTGGPGILGGFRKR